MNWDITAFYAGFSVWYDLHGASHVGMAASDAVLAQHIAVHSELHAQRRYYWPLRPHAACMS